MPPKGIVLLLNDRPKLQLSQRFEKLSFNSRGRVSLAERLTVNPHLSTTFRSSRPSGAGCALTCCVLPPPGTGCSSGLAQLLHLRGSGTTRRAPNRTPTVTSRELPPACRRPEVCA